MDEEAKIRKEREMAEMQMEKAIQRRAQNVRVFSKEYYFTETLMNKPKPNEYMFLQFEFDTHHNG